MYQLEERILFDGVGIHQPETNEVAFIASSVMDAQTIIDSLGANVEAVQLEAGRNGLSQINEYINSHNGIDAVHIVSHGNDGFISLNGQVIDSNYLEAHQADLASWQDNLSENADILLYGCNVAQTDTGKAFVADLASYTGADVAASVDGTGLNGDFSLEFVLGNIESNAINPGLYDNHLATITVTSNADSGAGTLRNSIASATPGDEIVFTLGVGNEVIILSSQLTIGNRMTINGTNTGGSGVDVSVVVPGASAYRAFEINSGAENTVTIQYMASISGGNISGFGDVGAGVGGSIDVASGNLVLDHVSVDNSIAYRGGAIYNSVSSTLTISNSQIHDAVSTLHGGGIYNTGTLIVNQDSYIQDSTATGNGGGIYNLGVTDLENAVILENTAVDGAGVYNTGGTITISNDSTVLNNDAGGSGGGIFNNAGTLNTRWNTAITGNTAVDFGGGVFGRVSINIEGTDIYNNQAGTGGGILIDSLATANISYSNIYSNSATLTGEYNGVGGGILINEGTLTLSNSTVSLNTAVTAGGGVAVADGTFAMTNSTIVNNSAVESGGAIEATAGAQLNIQFSTISGNSSTGSEAFTGYWGGVSLIDESQITMQNTILALNNDEVGNVDFHRDSVSETVIDNGYNIVQNSHNYSWIGTGDWTDQAHSGTFTRVGGGTGQLYLDSRNWNGGPTQTMRFTDPASIAIANGITSGLNIDQRSFARSAVTPTIGAYEYNGIAPDFRTADAFTSGNWDNIDTWNVSIDGGVTWDSADYAPDYAAGTITIRSGTVAISQYTYIDQATILAPGELNIESGVTLEITNGSGTDLSIIGLLVNDGTIANNGSISVSAGGTILNDNLGTITNSGSVTINGSYVQNKAVADPVAITGNALTYSGASSTLEYSGASTQTTGALEFGATNGPANLLIDNNTALTLAFSRTLSGGLTVDTGSSLNIGTNTLTVNGTCTIPGTLTIGTGDFGARGTFNATGGTIDFTGAGRLLLSGSAVTSLGSLDTAMGAVWYCASGSQTILADTYSSFVVKYGGIKTLGGTVTVNNALTVYAGSTLAVGANTLTVSGATAIPGTLTIGTGDFGARGTFNATGGTIDFTGAGRLLLSGSTVTSLGSLDTAIGAVWYCASG
ncbi:MAG TPA: hypothetical protein DD381_11435, partial [Lentisphaeria bacterium]|nr:hypothetical protein [Lentisphaeria bacterium]